MFGIRTPVKRAKETTPQPASPTNTQSVRRSIGEWETGKPSANSLSPKKAARAASTKASQASTSVQPEAKIVNRKGSGGAQNLNKTVILTDRVAEAKAILLKAKHHLGEARNLKTDIKVEVTKCVEKFYYMIKEIESERKGSIEQSKKRVEMETEESLQPAAEDNRQEQSVVLRTLEENNRLLTENSKKLEEINRKLDKRSQKMGQEGDIMVDSPTIPPTKKSPKKATLHSIIITSKDDCDTADEIMEKVRQQVKAKDGWIKVEKVRKAKNQKVIMSCGTKEEREKAKKLLERADMVVEEAKNKDPLLIARDVLLINSDEDILLAIRNQNKELFYGLDDNQSHIEIKYRRKARNPHAQHIVFSCSPNLWRRATERGSLHIDLQRVRVADQTPLVQCTRCLGYGHSKRFCLEALDICSHCGGPHLSQSCPDKLAGEIPNCRNCLRAKMDNRAHNAFSNECPVRKKWDEIARSTVSYC